MKLSFISKLSETNYVYDCQLNVVFAPYGLALLSRLRHLLIFDGGLCGTFIGSEHIFHFPQSVNKVPKPDYRSVHAHWLRGINK
jgi:hypothetical protein